MVSRDTNDKPKSVEELYAHRVATESSTLAKVLDTLEGRRVLFNVLARGDIYDLSGEMPFDRDKVQRALGRREVALELLKDILTVDTGVYILMQQEADEFEKQFTAEIIRGEDQDEY